MLLHRPHPRAVHVSRSSCARYSRRTAAAREPLAKPELAPKFRALLGAGTKPFECVGEVSECRAAVVLAARRADRAGFPLLKELAAEVTGRPDAPAEAEIAAMRRPVGENFVPTVFAFGES